MSTTVPIKHTALLWLQRDGGKDAMLSICQKNRDFYVTFTDPESGSDFQYVFRDYSKLVEYLNYFFDNMLVDDDRKMPYQYIQWDVPGFSSSIVKLENIDSDVVFGAFESCLDFFFKNT